MIYTLTFNPAIDYVVHIDDLKKGNIIRSNGERVFFGGKGINVSIVLRELGVPSVATGFIAGFTGDAVAEGITCESIKTDFVVLSQGLTRINIKIRAKEETDINGNGPSILPKDMKVLYEKLRNLKKGDILVMAGSIPKTLPTDTYEQIMRKLKRRGVLFVVDAEKDLLLNTLKHKPFLIKPNLDELGELFEVKLTTKEEALEYAKKLQKMGAKNVLVSMGEQGALLLDESGQRYCEQTVRGELVNSVGAGDSMVAGFLAGYLEKKDYEYALHMGIAAGSATAYSEGLANRATIMALL